MRCVIGIVLFIVLYFGSCNLLGEVVRARALANDPAHSQRLAQRARHEALRVWHAPLAVGAGIVAIAVCALPTVLTRMNERAESERLAAMERGEWR
jgi:hypothetical protein